MRYTFFLMCPITNDTRFHESNDVEEFLTEATKLHATEPKTVITVCDRVEDVMLFNAEWGGEGHWSMSGMFN